MSKRPLVIDLALYGLAALFAAATWLWTTLPSHSNWGAIALGGYAPAALCILILLASPGVSWFKRSLIAGATAAAVVAIPVLSQAFERANGVANRAQEEVIVVEHSGRRLLETGSPYLHADAIAALTEPIMGYNPYQPGMAVFGLPSALFGEHWWTDARLYFLLVSAACMVGAMRLLAGRAGKGLLLRAFQASFIFPVCALTFSTGGDDMPVVALMVLGLAFASRGRWTGAGLALGAAGALKLFAWPVAVVLAVLALRSMLNSRVEARAEERPASDGSSDAMRSLDDEAPKADTTDGSTPEADAPGSGTFAAETTGGSTRVVDSTADGALRRLSIGFLAPVALTMVPVLLVDARGFFDNVLAFGLGHGVVESPAQSPLPGFLVAQHVPGGELIAPALLGACAIVIAMLLWTRPPATAASAALWSAAGLSAAFLLMPSTRFGYLLYPIVLLGWWLPLRDAAATAPEQMLDESDSPSPGPSLAVEWWR
ncbi:glycosyltransferase 87 family protein [Glycomyces buryatensis]|uniref:DUF2029 domain-containing protein n=1 Tax=Glycomyces buryatensis TaxID=2570927 RepID=A0A4S8Q808_9ACTN|nr:glycosyltransferase 87 family protein [Glycomyces buryatensis]THV40503.1 DUF2029 domain-containing protein [Glycomyces buryatensis]